VTLSTVAATWSTPSVQQRDRDPTALYPNNDTLGKRLRLYVEENFHDS
jgi:hypothetical protein